MERISCNLSTSSVHFLPILAVWDHRVLDNLIAPHANKVEAAFLFDAVQNMQLSQGQVAAKPFPVPQPFLPEEKLPQTSQFQFYTKVRDLQRLEPLRFRMLIVVNPVSGRVPGPLITIILLPIFVWMKDPDISLVSHLHHHSDILWELLFIFSIWKDLWSNSQAPHREQSRVSRWHSSGLFLPFLHCVSSPPPAPPPPHPPCSA